MSRMRAADDFEAIRVRLEELRREQQLPHGGEPIVERPLREPDAVAHVPSHIVRRYLADTRRSSSR
jgi:hypothetical protein